MRTGLTAILSYLLFLMTSCIPDPLPVGKMPTQKPKIVVATQLIADQGLVVFLTRSINALDAGSDSDPEALLQQITINNAAVTLQHSGIVDTLLNLGSGVYGGLELTFEQGVSYQLHIKTDSLGEVSATSQVAPQVPINSIDVQLYDTGLDPMAQVKYSINDPKGKNFYMVNLQKVSATQDIASLLNPRVFTHLIDDETFDGEYFEETFIALLWDLAPGDSIAVFMSSVNEDYYKFLKLRNDRDFFSDFASEPMNYPTNVSGGYGFFNLHVPDVRVFVLD
jgi:hypothetical protein